jgi:hypothetical protein
MAFRKAENIKPRTTYNFQLGFMNSEEKLLTGAAKGHLTDAQAQMIYQFVKFLRRRGLGNWPSTFYVPGGLVG